MACHLWRQQRGQVFRQAEGVEMPLHQLLVLALATRGVYHGSLVGRAAQYQDS